MGNWHPPIFVVILSLIPTISFVIVLFMMIFNLNLVFFLGGIAGVLAIQSCFYAMYKSFKERKLKRLAILAFCLALIFIMPYTVYAITTPNWSFTVSTDKSVCKLGENVTITAMLTNNGYITHSLITKKLQHLPGSYITCYPKETQFLIEYQYNTVLHSIRCYNSTQWYETEFSLAPGQSVKKTVVWTQLVLEQDYYLGSSAGPLNKTGTYYVYAKIADNHSGTLFEDCVEITIEP